MIQEGPDTPKIGAPVNLRELTEPAMRRVKQLGVNWVLSGGPTIPWREEQLRRFVAQLKIGGLTLGNLMISGFPNTLYGRPGRDEEIDKVKKSIRAAGVVGIPVVEYNFYAHRIVEGYYEETGRGGRRPYRIRCRSCKGSAAVTSGRRPHAGRDVEEHNLLPQSGDSGRRTIECTIGPSSQRSAACAKPRLPADHGDG